MNAIAKDIETGEMHDIEGKGQFDIENKQISVINPQAFDDDPLRRKPLICLAKKELNWEPKIMFKEGLAITRDYFEKKLIFENLLSN